MIKLMAGIALTVALVACSQGQSEETIQATVEASVRATQSAIFVPLPTLMPQPTPTESISPTPSLTPTPAEVPTSIPVLISNTPSPTLSPTPTLSAGNVIGKIEGAVVRIMTPFGSGSGFIFDKDGWILTNAHVVEGVEVVKVIIGGAFEVTGVVGPVIPGVDIAVVRINSSEVPAVVALGNSSSIGLGDDVWAIGYPGASGDSITVTKGIVSSSRVIPPLSYLQTDAAINPGNSGGPLINSIGEVVGISTSKVSNVSVEGVGLAIAIDDAKGFLPYLKADSNIEIPTPLPGRIAIANNETDDNQLFEMISFDCHTLGYGNRVTAVAEGRVRNISDIDIHDIDVVVNWLDASGNLLIQGSSPLPSRSLAPKQSSSYSVISKVDARVSSCEIGFQRSSGGYVNWEYQPTATPSPRPTPQPEGFFNPVTASPDLVPNGGWTYVGRGDVLLKPLFVSGYYGSDYQIDWRPVGNRAIILSVQDENGHEVFKSRIAGRTSGQFTAKPGGVYSVNIDPVSQVGKWKIDISPVDPNIRSHSLRTVSSDFEVTEKPGRDWDLGYNFAVANDSEQALVVDLILYFTGQFGYHVDNFEIETATLFRPGEERTFIGSMVVDGTRADNYRFLDIHYCIWHYVPEECEIGATHE